MYDYMAYNYKEAQRQYEERIREAQACHAEQRRMLQQLAQVAAWFGNRLLVWSERLTEATSTGATGESAVLR